jgi:hypothetical protein
MATKKKQDLTALLMNAGKAAAGGIVAELAADAINNLDVQFLKDNPKVAESVPAIAGLGILYFVDEKTGLAPAAYGMIGASMAGFADDLTGMVQGFNRVNYKNMQGVDAAELQNGIDYIEQLQGEVFADYSIVEDDEDDEGMI